MDCLSPRDLTGVQEESLQTPAPPPLEDDDLRNEMSMNHHNGVLGYQSADMHDYRIENDIENGLATFRAPEPPLDPRNQVESMNMMSAGLVNVVDHSLAAHPHLVNDALNHNMLSHPLMANVLHSQPLMTAPEPCDPMAQIIEQSVFTASPSPIVQNYITYLERVEPQYPVSVEVQEVLEETIDAVVKLVDARRLPEVFNKTDSVEMEPVDEIPSSPEPEEEPETPVDDFLKDYVTNPEAQAQHMDQQSEHAVPLKSLIVTSRMDEEVAEVLKTYMKSQFGELRKRTAMHLLAIDERVGSYQSELRRLSAPLLNLAHQLEINPGDVNELKKVTGSVVSHLLALNEQMIRDRRTAILNFFERPLELADEHRFPRKDGDALFGKRFCYLNGLGFTKRRPRRKPVQRTTYRPAAPKKISRRAASFADETSHDEYGEEFPELEYDEEDDEEEEEEEISDEDWKVSEDEEADPEEEEEDEDSELESEEQEDIEGTNGNGAEGQNAIDDIWSESVRLMQLAEAADGVNRPPKKKKERTKKKKEGTGAGRRGRKRKPKPVVPDDGDDGDETKAKKRRRRRKSAEDDGGESNAGHRRRKKDGPTIERKIDPHCEYCDFEADRRHLIMHVRKAHPDKMIQCDQCPKKFAFKVSLWNHVVIMHGTAKFKCTQCTRSFRSEEKLRMHSFMHSEDKPFACEMCGKGCLTKRHLDAHVLIHEQRQQLHCQLCDRRFATNHNFRNHMKLHTGQKDFFCDICNAGFPIKARLTQHKRLHHSGEQYVCDICGKAFKARHILNDHKALRHSTEKSWVCEVCGAGFKLKSVLVRHLKTHSDERPYRCDICDKAFKDRSTLGVHRKTHSTDRPYLCEQCGMSFKRNAERKKHNCMGRMVHIPEDSSQSHHSQIPLPLASNPPSQVLAPPQPTHHIIMGQRPIQLANIMPHPVTLMSPATPGTSLQAQLMQYLDENLHAAGSQHSQPPNFSVN